MAYTNNADTDAYKMFSSNHPIFGFNRPAQLYVVDGMVNVSLTLTATVENLGTASSGVVNLNVLLLHNEYTYFEFVNQTVQMASLAGGSSNTAAVTILPTYAGNHTLLVRATSTVLDDVPANDVYSRGFAIGYEYFNCDSASAWTFGNGWSVSSDTSISKGTSCHVGNGQSSTYTNNMQATLTTPVMDLSDAVDNPTRTNGLSFFYTGSAAANDKLTMYGRTALGGWSEIGSFSGTIDQDFSDSANWQTFSVTNKGAASPLVPVAQELFHRSSQFKFEFTTDASGVDMGYWIDDIVIMYDQKVRQSEYNVSAQGVSTNGATPGEWGSITLKILNTGNITEVFLPQLVGLPESWDVYYTRPSGTSFDPADGLTASPSTPAEFNIKIRPDQNASLGFQQMSVVIASQAYPGITTTLPVQFLVMADRIPVILPPTVRPSCPPSYACMFEVDLTNLGGATDVFDLDLDTSTVPGDWEIRLGWSQESSVLIRPGETVSAEFTMTVPEGVAPDTVVDFDLTLRAQNDSSREDTKRIQVSASMISIASVELVEAHNQARTYVNAGDSLVLRYQIWNNASRQDIFSMRVEVEETFGWIVHQPTRPDAVLNPGTSTTFEIVVDVPQTAQANDRGPTITPVIESKRSLMEIAGSSYDGLRVTTTPDVTLELLSSPTKLTPGIPNEVQLLVTNNGNGPTDVYISPQAIPETWSWWLTVDGINLTTPLPLSVSYDLEHEAVVSLWVLLSIDEAAGEIHTVVIDAIHLGEGEDANLDDNQLEFTAATGAVRVPVLSLTDQSTSVMAGEIMHAEAVIENLGNAVEDRLSVTASVSSVPPLEGLVVFFTVDGGDRAVATPVDLLVLAGKNSTMRLEVLIPDHAPINTRFVLRFEITGALDQEGLPVEMEEEALVMLDRQRSMDLKVVRTNNITVQHGTSAPFWVNHTSFSSVGESYVLKANAPDGWQITCDKRLVNDTGMPYAMAAGHVTPQRQNHACEALRIEGSLDGVVEITVLSEDGFLRSAITVDMIFASPPEEDGLSSMAIATGSVGVVAAIGALLLFLRPRNQKTDVFDEIVEQHVIAGPPVSQVLTQDEASIVPQGEDTVPVQNTATPPLPEGGLPVGWTEEQWAYYGQQYLDGTL